MDFRVFSKAMKAEDYPRRRRRAGCQNGDFGQENKPPMV